MKCYHINCYCCWPILTLVRAPAAAGQELVRLRAKLSGAVYCNRSCLFVRLFVCGSVIMITRNCEHRSTPNWVCRPYLQLIKFWASCAPGKGICGGAKISGSALQQPARSVCISLSVFLSLIMKFLSITLHPLVPQTVHNKSQRQ